MYVYRNTEARSRVIVTVEKQHEYHLGCVLTRRVESSQIRLAKTLRVWRGAHRPRYLRFISSVLFMLQPRFLVQLELYLLFETRSSLLTEIHRQLQLLHFMSIKQLR